MRYDPDKVEWLSNGDNRVFYAQGLDEPDSAMIMHQILPGTKKDSWMYKVYDGERIERLHKITHIYTAQQLAIKELNRLYEEAEREAQRREPEREYADYHPNSYGAQTLRVITPPVYVHTETMPDARLVDAIDDKFAEELDAPIIVTNPLEELGYTVNSSDTSELSKRFPRTATGEPMPPTADEIAAQKALKASRKSTVPKVTNRGKTKAVPKTAKKASTRVKEKT